MQDSAFGGELTNVEFWISFKSAGQSDYDVQAGTSLADGWKSL